MQPGRAIGVAESYEADASTLAATVVRRDRVVDDFGFERCTVGGTDASDAAARLVTGLGRPDARVLILSGIAPAWFNLFDLHDIHERVDRPVLSVSSESSPGLGDALRREFDGDALAERIDIYERQPPRREFTVDGERLWVRAVGADDEEAARIVRAFTPEGGRPEPLRVARLAARAGDAFARSES